MIGSYECRSWNASKMSRLVWTGEESYLKAFRNNPIIFQMQKWKQKSYNYLNGGGEWASDVLIVKNKLNSYHFNINQISLSFLFFQRKQILWGNQ